MVRDEPREAALGMQWQGSLPLSSSCSRDLAIAASSILRRDQRDGVENLAADADIVIAIAPKTVLSPGNVERS